MTRDEIDVLWNKAIITAHVADENTRYHFAELVAAEYKRDAERYRFFIEPLDLADQLSPLHILLSKIGDRTPTKDELDAAIDAAMEKVK